MQTPKNEEAPRQAEEHSTESDANLATGSDPSLPQLFDDDLHPYDPTPYGGTSGWSGSSGSQARAADQDADGRMSQRDRTYFDLLAAAGKTGLTWFEAGAQIGEGHQEASGALSPLHKAGVVTRLKLKRSRRGICLLPDNAAGRDTEPYKPNVSKSAVVDACGSIRRALDAEDVETALHELATLEARYNR